MNKEILNKFSNFLVLNFNASSSLSHPIKLTSSKLLKIALLCPAYPRVQSTITPLVISLKADKTSFNKTGICGVCK